MSCFLAVFDRVPAEAAAYKGHIVNYGNKWGWENGEAFVPQLVMFGNPSYFAENPALVDQAIQTFIDEHGFNGFSVAVSCRWFDINEKSCSEISGSSPTYDKRTMDALKMLIQKTHAAGGMVHLWMWGDTSRKQNPGVRSDWGNLMGSVEQWLLDDIAKELGPLPGWSIGYGYDLNEWVTEAELKKWRDYLQSKLPIKHFIGGRPDGPNRGTDHSAYVSWNSGMDYASYEHHGASYDVYAAAMNANPDKPVFSEDRNRIWPAGVRHNPYTPDSTRVALWESAMAGGVANIWGNLQNPPYPGVSNSYPNKEQIKTYSRFFEGRFLKGLLPDNSLTVAGVALREGQNHALIYQRNTSSVQLNLSTLLGTQQAVAVDTMKAYEEIYLGTLQPADQVWTAPYPSDWAIAVGDFTNTQAAGKPVLSAADGKQ